MNNPINQKNGQISMFVLIGAILFLVVFFLILSSNNDTKSTIDLQVEQSTSSFLNIQTIYESSNRCLNLATQKAILLASLRGGLIYPNENFVELQSRPDLSSLISEDYANNLNLDYSNLQTFVYSGLSKKNYISELNKDNISKDLEHYILRDFVICQLDNKNIDLNINLSYSILNSSSKKQEGVFYFYDIENMILNENDTLLALRESGDIYSTKIRKEDLESQTFRLLFPFEETEKVILINKNSTRFNIDIQNKLIVTEIETSDSYSFKNSKLDNSLISFEYKTPFYSLILDTQKILTQKMFNRQFNFSNSSSYSNINLKNNLDISQKNININTDEIISLLQIKNIDEAYVFPYFFSLYKNTAPNITVSPSFSVSNSESINLASNPLYLKDNIYHFEFEDNLLHNYKFEKYDDSKVSLSENGELTIKVDIGTFSKRFYVTDGELSTPFEVQFNLGGRLNEDNSQVESCFDFTYNLGYLNPEYDVINEYISNSIRNIDFYRTLSGEYNSWIGFVSSGKSGNVQVTIDKVDDCFEPSDSFSITLPHTFSIDSSNTRDFSIQTFKSNGDLKGESFNFSIAGVDCLGPSRTSTISGTGSCCDMTKIDNYIRNDKFVEFANENFILPTGTIAVVNDNSYLCVSGPRANDITHWNPLTSILKTKQIPTNLQIQCEGNSPILTENSIQTSGSNLLGTYRINGTFVDVDVYYDDTFTTYPTCNECKVIDNENSILLENSGFQISINQNIEVQPSLDIFIESFTQREDRDVGGTLICENVNYNRHCSNGNIRLTETSRTPITC